MNIQVRDGLPYVTVTLLYGGRQLDLANVLLDTGSAGTFFAADQVLAIGLQYEADDPVQRIRGIGGADFVFVKRINRLSVGELQVSDFAIEVRAMEIHSPSLGLLSTGNWYVVSLLFQTFSSSPRWRSRLPPVLWRGTAPA
jgi:Aspartyl protease